MNVYEPEDLAVFSVDLVSSASTGYRYDYRKLLNIIRSLIILGRRL